MKILPNYNFHFFNNTLVLIKYTNLSSIKLSEKNCTYPTHSNENGLWDPKDWG